MLYRFVTPVPSMLYNFGFNRVQKETLENQARIWGCLLSVQAQMRVLPKLQDWC